ncbi:MAG: hypothetical protein MZV65_26310 [Chromatiales bacterium]|nr:hypothetical protein [Chromatiales bacterium]
MADEQHTPNQSDVLASLEPSPLAQKVADVTGTPDNQAPADHRRIANILKGRDEVWKAEQMGYAQERGRLKALAEAKPALSKQAEAGYLAVIAALTRALADLQPDTLKNSDGTPKPGKSNETGDTGVVGYLLTHGYSRRSERDLRKKISDALKQTE